jgi:hypothetical protein
MVGRAGTVPLTALRPAILVTNTTHPTYLMEACHAHTKPSVARSWTMGERLRGTDKHGSKGWWCDR